MNGKPETFKAVRVSDKVYWVGAVDWAVRDFHGYLTQRGSTYNAYLILADKITLVDTVKNHFFPEMLDRISSVVKPEEISYIISNHSEMDHSGSLPEAIAAIKPEKVFASPRGAQALEEHFHMKREITAVKDGQQLSLGNLNATFYETPMIHWPDSMITFLSGDDVLFSNDGFGMHLASGERFADEISPAIIEYEAAKYYANILTPLSPLIAKLLTRVQSLNLPIKIIAPDHGPIWRSDFGRMVGWYAKWARREPSRKAVVTYDTMWKSTSLMARTIAEGAASAGAETRLMPLKGCHRSDVVTEILGAGAILVGSPTLNNTILPHVGDLLTYLKGLRFQNLIGAAFGSYGWSGQAVGEIEASLREMKIELAAEGLKIKYVPDTDALAQCRLYGRKIGERLAALP